MFDVGDQPEAYHMSLLTELYMSPLPGLYCTAGPEN